LLWRINDFGAFDGNRDGHPAEASAPERRADVASACNQNPARNVPSNVGM
jgi:hypothetical protein